MGSADPVSAWAALDAPPDAVLAAASRGLAQARGLSAASVGRFADPSEATGHLPPLSDPLDLGRLYEACMTDARGRKAAGAFYTPPKLAAALTRATLDPLLEPRDGWMQLQIVDPSCGAGSFLLQALRRLRAAAPGIDAAVLLHALHGADLDPLAVAICADALWIELGSADVAPADVRARIHCGDALVATDLPDAPPGWRPLDWSRIAPDGFTAVLGNPPWDRDEPDSHAFFGAFEPALGRRRGRTDARSRTEILRTHPEAAAGWERRLRFLAARQRAMRERFPGSASATKTNAYQRFLALGLTLLREGGRIGYLVPAGLYADRGSAGLRDALFEQHRVETLIGFENRARLFPGVDRRFKFAALVAARAPRRASVAFGFLRTSADDLARGTPLEARRMRRLSPSSGAIVEVEDPRSLELLDRLSARARLGGPEWGARFRRELDLTLDRRHFVDDRRSDDLPVLEGRMIDAYCAHAKAWVEGRGRQARWDPETDLRAMPTPQFWVRAAELERVDPEADTPKIGFMAVGSATNTRTMLATVLWRTPCGNSVPTLRCRPTSSGGPGEFALCAVLNSTVFDWALRLRMAGNNLNRFVLDDVAVPLPDEVFRIEGLDDAVRALALTSAWFDAFRARAPEPQTPAPLLDPAARRHVMAVLDAIIAHAYRLDAAEYAHVLADTDLPCEQVTPAAAARGALPAKGFWRIDRELPPRARRPALARSAFERLDAGVTPLELLRSASQARRDRR
ncbi:MAG: hypothetical protein RL562_1999 [Planctomycetota bacterium]